MRIALVAATEHARNQQRLDHARALGAEVLLIAPPYVRSALRVDRASWFEPDPRLPLAAPRPMLLPAVAARRALLEAHAATRLDEVWFAAADASGWAAGLGARQAGELAGARLVVDLWPEDQALLRSTPLGEGVDGRLLRDAARQALRDADEVRVRVDEATRAPFVAAGWQLGPPRPEPAWQRGATPPISAIVTHKDLQRYLPECLASLRAQTLPMEIVLVDDGSSPAGLEAVRAEQQRDPALRVLHASGAGVETARNLGAAAASGQLLFFMDADDVLLPQCVERMTEALRTRPAAAACSVGFRAFEDGTGRTLWTYQPAEICAPTLFVDNTGGGPWGLHRRQAFEAIRGFRNRKGNYGDWDLWLRYAEAGFTSAVVPEMLIHYRIRTDSMLRGTGSLVRLFAQFRLALDHRALLATHAEEVAALAAFHVDGVLRQERARLAALEEQLARAEERARLYEAELARLREQMPQTGSSSAA